MQQTLTILGYDIKDFKFVEPTKPQWPTSYQRTPRTNDKISDIIAKILNHNINTLFLVDGDNVFLSLLSTQNLPKELPNIHVLAFLSSNFHMSSKFYQAFFEATNLCRVDWLTVIESYTNVKQAVDVRIGWEASRICIECKSALYKLYLVSSDPFVNEVRHMFVFQLTALRFKLAFNNTKFLVRL